MSSDSDTAGPSADDLASFAKYAEAFGASDFVAGEWHPSAEIEPNVRSWPWWESSPIVSEWHQALYDCHVIYPGSDYSSPEFSQRMAEFAANLRLIASLDLATVRTILTNISRGDRFCEGHMAGTFENGVAQAATQRLADLGRS